MKKVIETIRKEVCEGIENIAVRGVTLDNVHDLGVMMDIMLDTYRYEMLASADDSKESLESMTKEELIEMLIAKKK